MLAKQWASYSKLKKLPTIEKKTKKSKKLKKWLKNYQFFCHFSSEKKFYTNKIVISLYP